MADQAEFSEAAHATAGPVEPEAKRLHVSQEDSPEGATQEEGLVAQDRENQASEETAGRFQEDTDEAQSGVLDTKTVPEGSTEEYEGASVIQEEKSSVVGADNGSDEKDQAQQGSGEVLVQTQVVDETQDNASGTEHFPVVSEEVVSRDNEDVPNTMDVEPAGTQLVEDERGLSSFENLESTEAQQNQPKDETPTATQTASEPKVQPSEPTDPKLIYSSVQEFVDYEIWSRATWKHEKLSEFASDVVALGLVDDLKAAKSMIKAHFESEDFSAVRVVQRFMRINNLSLNEHDDETILDRLFSEHGGLFTRDLAESALAEMRGLSSNSVSGDSNSDGEAEDNVSPQADVETMKILSTLKQPHILRGTAKRFGLDVARYTTFRDISLEKVAAALEKLLKLETKEFISTREKAECDKLVRSALALTYKASESIKRAIKDLLGLVPVIEVSALTPPAGLKVTLTADNVYMIEHAIAEKLFSCFGSTNEVKYGWFSTNEVGALYALFKGYPFPGLERAFTLKGKRSSEAKVSMLFKVSCNPKHSSLETLDGTFIEDASGLDSFGLSGEMLQPNELLHVYEAGAVTPMYMVFSSS